MWQVGWVYICRENGVNINSTNQKDNFLINHIDNFNNHAILINNKSSSSTTITTPISSPSPHGHSPPPSPPTLSQLRILIPYSNYENLRSQQTQSSRAGPSQQPDRREHRNRNMMMNSMDRQMVSCWVKFVVYW